MKEKRLVYILTTIIIMLFFSLSFAAVPIEVTVGKETVLRLNKPIKSIQRVSLANDEIAEIKPLISPSPTADYVEIIINGKKPGITTLIVWDTEGKTFFDVIVTLPTHYCGDTSSLENYIKELSPNSNVTAQCEGDTLVLRGTIKNRFSCKRDKETVVTRRDEKQLIDIIETQEKEICEETIKRIEMITKLYATKVLNLITIPEAEQVLLEVRVAQIDKSKLRELGVGVLIKGSDAEGTFPGLIGSPSGILGGGTNFGKTHSSTGSAGYDTSYTTDRTSTLDNILGQISKDETETTLSTGYTTADTITDAITKTRGSSITGFDLNTLAPQIAVSYFPGGVSAFLKAVQEKGFGKILAEPNLVVRSGEEGKFHVGTRVPIQTVSGVGAEATPSISYEEVGVKLEFFPKVLETGVIRLKIDPAEVSGIISFFTFKDLVAPEINTRTVRTSVDLKEGESLILAGLLSEEMKKNIQKVPILGDIPILGALFRSTRDELAQTELVFFITPKLVKGCTSKEDKNCVIPPGVKTALPTDNRPTPEEEREFQWIPIPGKSEPGSKGE